MKQTHHYLTAVIEREADGYVARCPELDVASQGDTVEEAKANLREALETFFDCADPSEVELRLHSEAVANFERHFGDLKLGHSLGADNESIDADIARGYAHEMLPPS